MHGVKIWKQHGRVFRPFMFYNLLSRNTGEFSRFPEDGLWRRFSPQFSTKFFLDIKPTGSATSFIPCFERCKTSSNFMVINFIKFNDGKQNKWLIASFIFRKNNTVCKPLSKWIKIIRSFLIPYEIDYQQSNSLRGNTTVTAGKVSHF